MNINKISKLILIRIHIVLMN